MDDKRKNKPNESAKDGTPGEKVRVDAFLDKLKQGGALEDTSESQRIKSDKYDPDYIDLGDYEKSDTGYVSLSDSEPDMRVYDSAAESSKHDTADNGKNHDKNKSVSGKNAKSENNTTDKTDGKLAGVKAKAGAMLTRFGKKKDTAHFEGEVNSKRKRGWAIFGKIVLFGACIMTILMCGVAIAASMYLAKETVNDDTMLDLNSLELSYATRLMALDKEKNEWFEYERVFGDENRVWVSYADMPQSLIDVTIASEDQTFRKHHGVNWKRTFAAFANEYIPGLKGKLLTGTQGGSTITQQLVKNITNEASVAGKSGALRKLREIYRALMLERKYTKSQIMEAYLNTINLGGTVAGIEAAANHYFNKSCKDLTLAESASIICITKYPTKYNPFINPDENKKQREDVVLWMMHESGNIDDATYNSALAESKTFKFTTPGGGSAGVTDIYSYFTETAIDEVLADLQELKGLSFKEANDMFFEGGLTIYLTVDPFVQETMDDVADNGKMWPGLEYVTDKETGEKVLADDQIQAAMVVMKFNGEVQGVSGGIRGKKVSRGSNYALLPRNTGSSIKPIASYAPAIEINAITYSSVFADAPVTVINGQPWPRNYDNSYGAAVTVYDGVRRSLNTTAAAVLQLIGPDFSFDFMTTNLGITTLVDKLETDNGILSDRNIGLTLGDLTHGISPMEMAAAFQIFGDGGVYTTPHCYTKIVDVRGTVVLDKTRNVQVIQAISKDTAMIMNKILQGVVTGGTATSARYGAMPLAAKTGTSSDNSDFWMIGMNPYYVMSVWEGYVPTVKYMRTLRPHPTQLAFKEVMSRISEKLEYMNFPVSENVIQATYCTSTGYLASEGCPGAVGWYKKDNVPGYCSHLFVPTEEELAAAAAAAAG